MVAHIVVLSKNILEGKQNLKWEEVFELASVQEVLLHLDGGVTTNFMDMQR